MDEKKTEKKTEKKPDRKSAAKDAAGAGVASAPGAEKAAIKREKRAGGGKSEAAATLALQPGRQARTGKAARLATYYQREVSGALMKEFAYRNVMQVPRISKVVLNMGLGAAVQNPKLIEQAEQELMQVTGQKAVVTRARKAIANFKLREGLPIGCSVTLRRSHMWEFLDHLMNVALPRVRDFRGVSPKGFDGHGNYTLCPREHVIFPEINYDKLDTVKGLSVSIVTTAKSDAEGRALLAQLGMPFRR